MIKIDVAKAGAQLFNLSNLFNARVNDGFTPVKVQWVNSTDGNKPLDVKNMKAFLKGQIGQGTIKDDHVELEPKSDLVSWEDDGSGSQPDGITLIKLPPQVFTRDGVFYGYIGLMDASGTVITSINIWFNVDQNVMTAGANAPYYLDEIQAALSAVQRSNDTLQRAKQEIDNQISLSKAAFEPEGFENETALKAKYPAGASGLMVTVDTGHKWLWVDGAWKDCGIYQAAGMDPEVRQKVTYLDASNVVLQKTVQTLTDEVVDVNWFLGEIDSQTGKIMTYDRYNRAYSSLKAIGKRHSFEFQFSDIIDHVTLFEYSPDGKIIHHTVVDNKAIYALDPITIAVRFQLSIAAGTMGQNDLSDRIKDSGLKIIDRGHRSILSDIDHLYIREALKPIEAIEGYTINTNVDYGEVVDVDHPITTPSFSLVNYACESGDIFLVNELSGGNNALGWAFIDSQNRLISKSTTNLSQSQLMLYAPSETSRLVINNMASDCSVYRYTPDTVKLSHINVASTAILGHNITLAYEHGETVPLTPEKVSNYRYTIIDCSAGDEFRIKGCGGRNPRLWGFLSKDNRLMSVAPASNSAYFDVKLKAPKKAAKLVANFNIDPNVNHGMIGELYRLPKGTISEEQSFDSLVEPPVDLRMSSYINGIKLGKDLSAHLADFAKPGDKMVHVSTFYKIGDTLYMSYYANTRTDAEDPTQHTARLVYAPFDNLSQQTYIDVADIGQEYNGQTIDAIYDSLLLKTSDDSYMIYAFTAKVGGKFYMLYRRFDPKTKLLSDTHTMNFKAGALSGTFDTVSIHDLLAQIGVDYDYEDRDISFVQKLSPRIENGVVQYYAGIGILHFCFIAKSSDLINWTFVSAPDFAYQPEFEPSVYVKGDSVYYCCRQRWPEANAILAKYDINNDCWSQPILVPDTQSRYDFFEDNDQLYLVHSPLDRNHISLMQIDQYILEKSYEVATAEVQDCFYPFTQNIAGQMYMSFTQSRHHIWLNKFSPTYYSSNDVANFFSKITE